MANGETHELNLEQVIREREERRATYEKQLDGEKDTQWKARINKYLDELKSTTPEQELRERQERDGKLRQIHEKQEQERRAGNWHDLLRLRGRRYSLCTLENFEATLPQQKSAVASIREYAADLPSRVRYGDGVVLFGPPGTGKDHLLMGLARIATLQHGLKVTWRNGLDLFAEFRAAINRGDEWETAKPLIHADILGISDPIPPFGGVTEYQAATIARILDTRYSDCKPTWVTINTASRDEANERLGSQAIDRLSHGALVLHCDWPSFREPRNQSGKPRRATG